MIFIKLFLLVIVTLAFVIFAFSSKLGTLKKLVIIGGYAAVAFFILFPAYADRIAHLFSIKSGTDLIVYIVLALIVLMVMILYVGQNKNSRMITKVIREIAKENAKKCS